MANYLFEQMSDQDALAYDGSTDHLFFLTGTPGDIGVQYNPAAGLSLASITLTDGGISHTFVADALAGNPLTFFSSTDDTLAFGHDSSADTATVSGTADHAARYYALGGDDNITGSAASDTIFGGLGNDTIHGVSATTDGDGNLTESDFLNGGAGADSITGGIGNDHIYGNASDAVAGSSDGGDHIDAGAGNDYVNGNGGDDSIIGNDGNDKLYGGAGDDSIDGGNGHDYMQGNKGADHMWGDDGNDTMHGGADDDSIDGGNGTDQLFGDNGDDVLHGGAGYDQLWGGAGKDTFNFTVGDADNANVHTAATAAGHGVVETINDFTDGSDHIHLPIAVTTDAQIHHTAAGASFTDAAAAQDYAQTLLTGHGTDIAAITVGSDTYLFYDDTGLTGTIDSAIKIVGVTDGAFTHADFV